MDSRCRTAGEDETFFDVALLRPHETIGDAEVLAAPAQAGLARVDPDLLAGLETTSEGIAERSPGKPDRALDEKDVLVGGSRHTSA